MLSPKDISRDYRQPVQVERACGILGMCLRLAKAAVGTQASTGEVSWHDNGLFPLENGTCGGFEGGLP